MKLRDYLKATAATLHTRGALRNAGRTIAVQPVLTHVTSFKTVAAQLDQVIARRRRILRSRSRLLQIAHGLLQSRPDLLLQCRRDRLLQIQCRLLLLSWCGLLLRCLHGLLLRRLRSLGLTAATADGEGTNLPVSGFLTQCLLPCFAILGGGEDEGTGTGRPRVLSERWSGGRRSGGAVM